MYTQSREAVFQVYVCVVFMRGFRFLFPMSSLLQTQELEIFTLVYKEVMKLSQLCAIPFIYSIQLGE